MSYLFSNNMRNEVPKEKNTRRSGVCYLDVTTLHVRSAAAVEEHLPTTSGSEKAAFQFRIDGSGFIQFGQWIRIQAGQNSSQKVWRLMEIERSF